MGPVYRYQPLPLIAMALCAIAIVMFLGALLHGQVTNIGTNVASGGRYPSDGGRSWAKYISTTNTSAQTMAAAPGAGVRVYLYQASCVNVHASTQAVALIKYGSTTVAAVTCRPASGNAEATVFDPPLGIPANTALTMTSSASVTTLHFFAEGTTAR